MKKSKWDIIGKEIDKDINSEYDSWFYWWYDGEDYFDHDYGQYYTYDYSEPVYREYFSKRGKWSKDRQLFGNYIDMMSIYSKEMLRQKKIDMILDDIKDLSNTIENLLLSKGIQVSFQDKSCSKA